MISTCMLSLFLYNANQFNPVFLGFPWIFGLNCNSVDPDQLKLADLNLHCVHRVLVDSHDKWAQVQTSTYFEHKNCI